MNRDMKPLDERITRVPRTRGDEPVIRAVPEC